MIMKTKLAIVDERISEAQERSLLIRGFRTLKLPPHSALGASVASHTDMLICKMGGELISCAEYCERYPYIFTDLSQLARGYKISFTADSLSAEYPSDCKLNVLIMSGCIFCRVESVSPYILELAKTLGLKTVPVKQGYPACTVLKLSERVAVTADSGMARALSEAGIEVIKIKEGHISLPPHEFGFIGGAAGVYGDTVYFLGRIEDHPSHALIKEALDSLGMNAVSLSDEPLRDLGGILLIEADI